jgi:hypothetical protein
MKREHVFLVSIFFLSFLSFYLFYQILSPFLTSIFWAIFLAIAFYPFFQKLQRLLKKRGVLSAMTMTLLVILVIVIPSSLLMVSLANEVVEVYQRIEEMIKNGRLQAYLDHVREIPIFKWVWERFSQSLNITQMDPSGLILKNLQQVSSFLFNQTSKIFKGLSTFMISFFFTLLSLYYLFKDGDRLFERLPSSPEVQRDGLCDHLWRGRRCHCSRYPGRVDFLDLRHFLSHPLGNSNGFPLLHTHRWNCPGLGPSGYSSIGPRGSFERNHPTGPGCIWN